METYTPMRAMIICTNGTGDYIKKEDAIKALQEVLENWVRGGESDCIIAEFETKFNSKQKQI